MTSRNAENRDSLPSSTDDAPGKKVLEEESRHSATSLTGLQKRDSACADPVIETTDILTANVESVMQENERLKKQLIHVETLGRLVADCKQSNLRLSKENGELQERLNQLLLMHVTQACSLNLKLNPPHTEGSFDSNDPDGKFAVAHEEKLGAAVTDGEKIDWTASAVQPVIDGVVSASESGSDATSSFSSPMLKTDHAISTNQTTPLSHGNDMETLITRSAGSHPDCGISGRDAGVHSGRVTTMDGDDPEQTDTTRNTRYQESPVRSVAMEATAAAVFCERQAQISISSLSQEISAFNEVLGSDYPATYEEICQLEDIVGEMNAGEGGGEKHLNSASFGEESKVGSGTSVTAQFAKLANIFARLAQRVILTQKKARNSQAFCDALLRENDKLKTELSTANKKVGEMKNHAEEQKSKVSHDSPQKKERGSNNHSCSGTEESAVKENNDVALDEIFASITDPVAKNFITKLRNRIRKLEGQRTEILTVNKQWHTQYNKLKEECDVKLTASRAELEDLKEQITGKQLEQAKRRKDINVLLLEAKKEIETLQRQKAELAKSYAHEHSKIKTINQNIEKLKADLSCVQAENQRLNQALEAAYSIRQNRQLSAILCDEQGLESTVTSEPVANTGGHEACEEIPSTAPSGSEDLRTRVEVLQEQVKIYREDFETERRDREKSQVEKQRLTEEMARMRDEIRALNQQVRANEQDFRQERREKQRLQRQLSRIQAQVANNGNPAVEDYYYDDLADNVFQRSSPARDRHRYAGAIHTEIGERVVQTATAVEPTRRYSPRTRTNPPPPYTQDSSRPRRRPVPTTTRRIRDGYLEPRVYNQDLDVVYPPDQY